MLANSRKYTEPGGRINAGLTETEDHIRFVIEDTGIGIPNNELEKVIDFGYRASNLEGKKTHGGGFGLTKAYSITKNNNGRFWIDSQVNLGTTIKIEIPKPKS